MGALGSTLDALLSSRELAGDQVGFVLMDATGHVRFARNADIHFVPASCRKVLTTACALSVLGPDTRFATTVEARGTIRDHVLDGDLILVGGGDPSLDDSGFADLAQQVRAAGIERVTGSLQVDAGAFRPQEAYPDGWSHDDLSWYYAPPISALEADEDRIHVDVLPQGAPGTPAAISVASGDAPFIKFEGAPGSTNGNASVPATGADWTGQGARIPALNGMPLWSTVETGTGDVIASPWGKGLLLTGSAGAKQSETLAFPHPATLASWRFADALAAAGVQLEGQIHGLPGPAAVPQIAAVVARHLSPSVAELVARTNKPSDNLFAELLLRQIGLSAETASAERSTATAGATNAGPAAEQQHEKDTLELALAKERSWLGFAPGSYRLVDGSGLSRYDLLTPRQLATVLWRMRNVPAFVDSLPIAGRDGTLAHRMVGTPAAGRVRAKTGSMSGVSTLAGYAGDQWIVAFMDNGHVGPLADVRKIEDAICLALIRG